MSKLFVFQSKKRIFARKSVRNGKIVALKSQNCNTTILTSFSQAEEYSP